MQSVFASIDKPRSNKQNERLPKIYTIQSLLYVSAKPSGDEEETSEDCVLLLQNRTRRPVVPKLKPEFAAAAVVAAATAPVPPLPALAPTAPPMRLLPVALALVSLLFWPVGCSRSNGMLRLIEMNWRMMTGPMISTRKSMNSAKYRIAKRITLRFRRRDCLSE